MTKKKVSFIALTIVSIITYIILLIMCTERDSFFGVPSGRDILDGNFHTVSHLDNFPMVIQQWGYLVILYFFDKLGYWGHVLLTLIQNIVLVILGALFIDKKVHDKKYAFYATFIGLIVSSVYLVNVRPETITMIFFIIELMLLEKYNETNKIRYLLYIIPVLIVAANVHQAVFLYHMYALIPFMVIFTKVNDNPDSVKTFFKDYKIRFDWKVIAFTPIYLACSLCTPYGIDGSLYIVRTFMSNTMDIVNITECRPRFYFLPIGVSMLFMLGLAVYLFMTNRSNKFVNFFSFTVFLCYSVSFRHCMLLIIPVIYILRELNVEKVKRTSIYLVLTVLCLYFGINSLRYDQPILNEEYGQWEVAMPDKDAKIYNICFDVGPYLEYIGYTKVRFDGRIEAFSEEVSGVPDVLDNNFRTHVGRDPHTKEIVPDEQLLDIVDDYDYIISYDSSYINRLLTEDWEIIYVYGDYIVWENNLHEI